MALKTCVTLLKCDSWLAWPFVTWHWPWLLLNMTLCPCGTFTIPFGALWPSVGQDERMRRPQVPKRGNTIFSHLSWPWPDTWPFKTVLKHALESSLWDLSNAASPSSSWDNKGAKSAPRQAVAVQNSRGGAGLRRGRILGSHAWLLPCHWLVESSLLVGP